MPGKRKWRTLALLCALVLCVPAACGAGSYWCDVCEDETPAFEQQVGEPFELDGELKINVRMVCSVCGTAYEDVAMTQKYYGPLPATDPPDPTPSESPSPLVSHTAGLV